MNIILYPSKRCPECYSKELIEDYERIETYCSKCGLVVANNVPLTLTEAINYSKTEQLQKDKENK